MSSVSTSLEAAVLTVTVNRPESRNALDVATYRALSAALDGAASDGAVGAVVLAGAGGHFTAGNDLRDFQGPLPPGEPPGLAFLRALAGFGKPLLAAVEGVAVGIGTTLLLHCDFAYAGRGARLRMPFVNLGLCPEGASTFLLPRLVGQKRAAEWLLLGREISGAEAAEAGLVTAAVDDGGALPAALGVARELMGLPPEALRVTRALLRRPLQQAVQAALEAELAEFRIRRESAEAQAAFAAFFARRGRQG